jgi:hypothetical protein
LEQQSPNGDQVCRFLLGAGCFAAELRQRVEQLAGKRRLSKDEVSQNAGLLLLEHCRRNPTLGVDLRRGDQEVWGYLGRRLGWIVRDAVRRCRRLERGVATSPLSEHLLTTLPGREEPVPLEEEETRRWLWRVIHQQLPRQHRQIIELVLENDLDLRRPGPIIDRLRETRGNPDMPYHTGYHMIQRARQALARALGQGREQDYSMSP